jgi:hypothetical protein
VGRNNGPNLDWDLIQAGSRFITTAAQNNTICELELLGIVWACKKTQKRIIEIRSF